MAFKIGFNSGDPHHGNQPRHKVATTAKTGQLSALHGLRNWLGSRAVRDRRHLTLRR
jgi:hypothetical protein